MASYSLRPYQREAVEATLAHFRRLREPAVIVLPTGAGKSLVIAELARLARGRVLVLTHVKELVEQNSDKFKSYGLKPGIYSAGLNQKDSSSKVIFGSIQSVARADSNFFKDFSLLVIDECHRVSFAGGSQYSQVINKISRATEDICVLGLTATPYRLDSGWIYQFNCSGYLQTDEKKFFKRCIYELNINYMIDKGYLTPPVQIDAPVASYDFSSLELGPGEKYKISEIEKILKRQERVTPGIVKNIVDLSNNRRGVVIFTSTIKHAEEIIAHLPQDSSAIVIGDTPGSERDEIIQRFKQEKIKFLVNVSVLTTGFDAPHIDVIAILRPTESVGLYQQIVGRGLRLNPGKEDCLVLDYTGVVHDIYKPEISEKKPSEDSTRVEVPCPMCQHVNDFWGIENREGELVEHFGKKCRGALVDPQTLEIVPCGFRYRFRNCDKCGTENDVSAKHCSQCLSVLVDNRTKIKLAMSQKDAHVLRPETMVFKKKVDEKNRERLEVRYYDLEAQYLSEIFYLNSPSEAKSFYYNFVRMHNRLPEKQLNIENVDEAIINSKKFRLPMFILARKQKHFWKIREKIF